MGNTSRDARTNLEQSQVIQTGSRVNHSLVQPMQRVAQLEKYFGEVTHRVHRESHIESFLKLHTSQGFGENF